MQIRVAQIKIIPGKGEIEANFERLTTVLEDIASDPPDVVVCSECFLDGYVSTEAEVTKETIGQYGVDPADSDYVRTVCEWCRAHSTWLIFGCIRLTPEGALNSALVIDRNGYLQGTYDKTHLQHHDLKFLPGQGLPVFPSDFGPFGVLICADRRWPETVRTLALRGARIIFNPTYGMHAAKNLRMMQTRSYESEIYIAFTHPALALFTDPTGEVICSEDSEAVSYVVTTIDLAAVDKIRQSEHSHLKDRRPELYFD